MLYPIRLDGLNFIAVCQNDFRKSCSRCLRASEIEVLCTFWNRQEYIIAQIVVEVGWIHNGTVFHNIPHGELEKFNEFLRCVRKGTHEIAVLQSWKSHLLHAAHINLIQIEIRCYG